MVPEFEVCNTTRSTITEEPFSRESEYLFNIIYAILIDNLNNMVIQ